MNRSSISNRSFTIFFLRFVKFFHTLPLLRLTDYHPFSSSFPHMFIRNVNIHVQLLLFSGCLYILLPTFTFFTYSSPVHLMSPSLSLLFPHFPQTLHSTSLPKYIFNMSDCFTYRYLFMSYHFTSDQHTILGCKA